MQKVIPFLWFDNQAEEAVNFYTGLSTNWNTGRILRYNGEAAEKTGRSVGSVLTIEFEIEGKKKRVGPGDSAVIPGNVTHEAWVIEDVEMANIFSPVRNDYLTEGALDYMKK